jgi:hypothetical protein
MKKKEIKVNSSVLALKLIAKLQREKEQIGRKPLSTATKQDQKRYKMLDDLEREFLAA